MAGLERLSVFVQWVKFTCLGLEERSTGTKARGKDLGQMANSHRELIGELMMASESPHYS